MERATWPEDGKVGRITKGEYTGAYLLLAPEIDNSWGFYISDDPRHEEQGKLRADDFFAPDDVTPRLLDEMGVIWVEASEDEQTEKEIFDIRSEWRKRRRARGKVKSFLHLLCGRRNAE
ncbi:hypothetical protein [Streptomyces pseudovenezuelae]|uniref:hypothetical protein n=1 Tax=Streptomyces pseudovenezuelae TaxID=67350 RepID=UPI0036E08A19